MIRRHYIETTDVSGSTEAQIALAETLLDQYVGPQDRFYRGETFGQITALTNSNKTIADTSETSQLGSGNTDYLAKCHIEIIGGTGVGQVAYIASHDPANKTITLYAAFSTTPDTTSVFKVYQLAKFPRRKDSYGGPQGNHYYKSIVQAVKDACVAQTQFIIAKGDAFFTDDGTDMQSESFLNYSYSRSSGAGGDASSVVKLMAPEARVLLRGIYNRKGKLLPGAPDVSY